MKFYNYSICLCAFLMCLMACEKEEIKPVETRGEGFTHATMPVDFAYHPPSENIIVECDGYQFFTTPPYITGVLQFDIAPTSIVWMYGNSPVDLSALFPDFSLYWSGHNVALIVHGTNVYSNVQAKIWCRDGSGAKNYLSFGRQQFNFLGAITPNDQLDLIPQILSARRFGFYNSGLNCAEFEQLIQILKDNCVNGSGKIMDIRFAPCLLNTDLMEYLDDSGWQILN